MTLIEIYKDRMFNTLNTVYNGQIKEEYLKNLVEKTCKNVDTSQIQANCRSLYEYKYRIIADPNEIPNMVKNENLNILSNGLFTYEQEPIVAQIAKSWLSLRGEYKKKYLQYKSEGDTYLENYYNGRQNKVKENTNSLYGAATMKLSFVSNIDMGGAITAQARNFISEQVWAMEKFIGNNFVFDSVNEIFLWCTKLFEIKETEIKENMSKLSYIPTVDDCLHKFILITKDVDTLRKQIKNMHQTIFLFFVMMEDWKRVAFYYANNPIEIIARNKNVSDIMDNLIKSDIEFINPYDIPDGLKPLLKELLFYMETFGFAMIMTKNRVDKYISRPRQTIVLGDTDSAMPSVYEVTLDTLKLFNAENLIDDPNVGMRMKMVYVTIIQKLLDAACLTFVKSCNSHKDGDYVYMQMKNEFFFPKMLIPNVKKLYIGTCTIQEGKTIPPEKQLAITGKALGSSSLNDYVNGRILDLLENKVLRTDSYDPLEILREISDIEKNIVERIERGDKSFGIYARYNGIDNVKDPLRTSAVRSACIWNDLFPEEFIAPGDAIYLFDTTLEKEEDLDRFLPGFDDMRERIREIVFNNKGLMDYSNFGMKSIAIPFDNDHIGIPKWLIPYISTNSLVEKHLLSITTLKSSLLLSPCKYKAGGSSVKKMGSSYLVRF